MNTKTIKSFIAITTENEESYFDCVLNDGRKIHIAYWSFYQFATEADRQLDEHSLKFDEWEKLTTELLDLEYDFEKNLNLYIQQFTEDEIDDFTLSVD